MLRGSKSSLRVMLTEAGESMTTTIVQRPLRIAQGASGLAIGLALLWAPAARAHDAAAVADAAASALAAGDAAGDLVDTQNSAEITVTARKRTERLQDVPLSISSVNGDAVKVQKLNKLQDFAQNIANFNPYTSNPRTSALSIRGVGGINGGSDGSESGVGLIVDDVFYTYTGFAWGPIYDVAALEVARGPQGTLLGKNTTVGAVIIRTNGPSFTPSTELEASGGNHGELLVRGSSTGALVGDKIAYRLSFYRETNDGFYPNNVPTLDDSKRGTVRENNTNRWSVRGQLLFTPTDTISDRLIVDHGRTKEYNNYSGTVVSPFTHYANGTPYRTYAQKIAQLYGIGNIDYNPYTGEQTNPSPFQTEVTGISNNLSIDFGGVTLTSVTAYRNVKLWPRNSQGNNGLYNYSLGYDNDNSLYSQEFRLASRPSKIFDWQVGAYGLIDKRRSNDRIIFGKDAASFYGTTLPASFTQAVTPTIHSDVLNGLEYDQLGKAETHSVAAFGQGTLHILAGLDLTGGVRFTHEVRKGSDTASSFGGVDALSASDLTLRNTLLRNQFGGYFAVAGKNTNNSVSWLVNPSYKITRDIMIYGSAARGVKSGAINTVAVPVYSGTTIIGYTPVVTKPERSLDFEAGIKSAWFDRKVVINVNLYQNDIHNYQGSVTDTSSYHDVNGAVVTKTYLGNIPHVRLRGIEAETSWQVSPWLQLHAAGAVTSAKYIRYADAGAPVDLQYAGGPKTVDESGQKVSRIPPWSINAGVNLDKAIGQIQGHDVALFGYVNESVLGKTRFTDALSTYDLGQKTFGITNASIGVRRLDDRIAVSIWAKNLFDKKYTFNKTLGSTNAAATWSLGDPRTFGGTVSIKL